MKIAVVGAGAAGCYFGGMLARAGHGPQGHADRRSSVNCIAHLIFLCLLKLFDQPVLQRNRLGSGTQMGCHPKRKPVWPRHETKRGYKRSGAKVVPDQHSRDICDAKSTLRSLNKQVEMLK